MGTEKQKAIDAAIDLLIKEGFKKPVRKKGPKRNLDLEIVYLLGRESVFVKKGKEFSPRKVQMRVAKSAALDKILDKYFNTVLFKTLFDPDYFPPNYNKKLKKGIIALGKGGVRKLAAAAAKKASSQK